MAFWEEEKEEEVKEEAGSGGRGWVGGALESRGAEARRTGVK